jgi:hypothetical protein
VSLTQLEQLVPVDRSQRIVRPLGSNFDNRLPVTLANGQVVETGYDVLGWNAHNFMLSPGSWNEDLSAFKYFDITERIKVRFTSDFFNSFNHPLAYILGDPNRTLNTTTGLLDLSKQENDPRIIQFSLRLEW